MTRSLIFLFTLTFSVAAHSQGREYSFKVALDIGDGKTKAATDADLILNGSLQTTNSAGMIYVTLNSAVQTVKVAPADESKYVIVAPSRSGVIDLPSNNGAIIEILLHNPNAKEKAYIAADAVFKKLNIDRRQLENLKASNYAKYEEIIRMQDSIYKSITKNYKISEADLRNADAIMDGRDRYFSTISATLESYLNEAKDVKDAFAKLVQFSLDNRRAYELLDSTRNIYNKCYNSLNNDNSDHERAIANFWGSNELALNYHNVIDFAINNIHRAAIIPLNTTVISKANAYIHEKANKKKRELKQELEANLQAIIPLLENSLGILDVKTKSFILKLEAQKAVFPD